MIIAIFITAFVGVLFGCAAAYIHMQKNAKTPTVKEYRESDRIEEEYKTQQKVERKALREWADVHYKAKGTGDVGLRESIEAGHLVQELSDKHDREKEKLDNLKEKFKQSIANEMRPAHKGISLEQILAISRCEGYNDDRIRKLFGKRHYIIPQTILDADIPAEDKLWALFHLIGDNKRHRLVLEACARANIAWAGHSAAGALWDLLQRSRHEISIMYSTQNPPAYHEELMRQLKRAAELMEES